MFLSIKIGKGTSLIKGKTLKELILKCHQFICSQNLNLFDNYSMMRSGDCIDIDLKKGDHILFNLCIYEVPIKTDYNDLSPFVVNKSVDMPLSPT
jgi:hypothetical protein